MGLKCCDPRCGGCGPAGGVPLLEPELLEEPDDLGVGGNGLGIYKAFLYNHKIMCIEINTIINHVISSRPQLSPYICI